MHCGGLCGNAYVSKHYRNCKATSKGASAIFLDKSCVNAYNGNPYNESAGIGFHPVPRKNDKDTPIKEHSKS